MGGRALPACLDGWMEVHAERDALLVLLAAALPAGSTLGLPLTWCVARFPGPKGCVQQVEQGRCSPLPDAMYRRV